MRDIYAHKREDHRCVVRKARCSELVRTPYSLRRGVLRGDYRGINL